MTRTLTIEVEPTKDEKKIVTELSYGLSVRQIGEKFYWDYSTRTVEAWVSKMLAKFGCKNSNELVAVFLRNKFIQ